MSKKQGVKRGSQAHRDNMAALQKKRVLEDKIRENTAYIHALDRVTLALGRMGFRKKRFLELDRLIQEVDNDYREVLERCRTEDPEDCAEMKELFDRELKRYVGEELFFPWDDRWDVTIYTPGLRIKVPENETQAIEDIAGKVK